jgi:gliding motility-associated-like protein
MKKIVCIFLLLHAVAAFSQKQGNIWYFGINAGVDFNSGSPTALLDGQVNTYEGSASIADANGSLLFYTDGVTVWNKQHQAMENGEGLLGNISTTQVVIVQKPGSETQYYIFTAAAGEELGAGLRYTEVDMALNNGLGAVTQNKNIPLFTNANEQITATFHHNGADIWLINRNYWNGDFYAYLITPAGVSTTPVISPGGGPVGAGYMKASPDGSKLAMATLYSVELYDFNNSTGVAGNGTTLTTASNYYGLEFSPSGKRLYASMYIFAQVVQFNLDAPNIAASATLVLNDGIDYYGGGLQTGPDGKIYMSNYYETSLTVINNPDALGAACNVVPHAVSLGDRTGWIGLPFAFWTSALSIEVENVCLGAETSFSFTADAPYNSVLWDFGDGTTSVQENPVHTYAAAGTYTVTFTGIKPGIERVLTQEVVISAQPQFTLGGPYEACIASSVTLSAEAQNFNPAQATYLWEFNGQPVGSAATLQPQEFGNYTLTVMVNGCTTTQAVEVVRQTLETAFTEGCDHGGYMLHAAPVNGSFNAATATYSWQGPDGFSAVGQQVVIENEGVYNLTITTPDGCVIMHEWEVADATCAQPFIPKGVSPNGDGKNDAFDLTGLDVKQLDIFNRYGLQVFSQQHYTTQWHGQTNEGDVLPDGTYYYRILKHDGINITGWVYVNHESY